MSHATIARAAGDTDLRARVEAATNREVIYNDELAGSAFGQQVLSGLINWQPMMWAVAVETEAAYETAVNAGRGAPGHDVDIITDNALTAAIVANWPADPVPMT